MTNKLLKNPEALTNVVRRAAIKAGDKTLEYYDDAGFADVDSKSDDSPVTIADKEAEAIIKAALAEATPDVPFIGEESTEAGEKPNVEGHDYFWLVDPLDGTKAFISGDGDYTVNIALIHKGHPVLGVIYIPVRGELYSGFHGGPAKRWLEDTDNEKEIRVRSMPTSGAVVVASTSHGNTDERDRFLKDFKIKKVIRRHSSLKICSVAAGKADLYPRFGPSLEWDVAAGDAILRAAGGCLVDMNGAPLTYKGFDAGPIKNPPFLAASLEIIEAYFDGDV